jgi:hypothetical protein
MQGSIESEQGGARSQMAENFITVFDLNISEHQEM